MALINCPECGKEISDNANKCVNCGCPIIKYENIYAEKSKKKKNPIVVLVILVIAALLILVGVNQYKSYTYQQNLNAICYEIISSGIEAEECGNLIHDVWYNTIFKESSEDTDKYTKENNEFNEDFNDSLDNLYNDKDFTEKVVNIQIKQKSILNMMKEMKNPPSKHKDAYKALLALYDEYNDFSSLVINPTGSLQSFTEEFNEADKSLADYCDKIKMYID